VTVLNVDVVDVRTLSASVIVGVTVNSVLRCRADVTDDGAVYGLSVRDDNDADVPGGKYAGRRVELVGRARTHLVLVHNIHLSSLLLCYCWCKACVRAP